MGSIWETETLALRTIVFPKTGTKRKVLGPFYDEVVFQEFPNHENLLFLCLVRPDSVKLRGKRFVWSVRSSWTPLKPLFESRLPFSSFFQYLPVLFRVVPDPMGPKKRHTKGSHFIKQCRFWKFVQFSGKYFCGSCFEKRDSS